MRWAGHVVHMGGKRTAYRILVGKPEGMILVPLGDLTLVEGNIKMDLREID
jgi:hypothetical protein